MLNGASARIYADSRDNVTITSSPIRIFDNPSIFSFTVRQMFNAESFFIVNNSLAVNLIYRFDAGLASSTIGHILAPLQTLFVIGSSQLRFISIASPSSTPVFMSLLSYSNVDSFGELGKAFDSSFSNAFH